MLTGSTVVVSSLSSSSITWFSDFISVVKGLFRPFLLLFNPSQAALWNLPWNLIKRVSWRDRTRQKEWREIFHVTLLPSNRMAVKYGWKRRCKKSIQHLHGGIFRSGCKWILRGLLQHLVTQRHVGITMKVVKISPGTLKLFGKYFSRKKRSDCREEFPPSTPSVQSFVWCVMRREELLVSYTFVSPLQKGKK